MAAIPGLAAPGVGRDRSKIPESETWNLKDLYPDQSAWRIAKEAFVPRLDAIATFRGRLAESPQVLLACMTLLSDLSQEFTRLYVYASLASDLDTRDASCLAMVQDMGQIGVDFGARSAFVQPEVLQIPRGVFDGLFAAEPGLEIHRMTLDDIVRRKDHTGSEPEEKIIADAALMADGPDNIYGIFSNAEFPFPTVTLEQGEQVRLDKAAFSLYRAAPNRSDRRNVFAAYFGALHAYRRTFGTQLYAQVKKDMFYMKARHYPSCLAAALDGNNIPVEVYHSVIASVRANLGTLHRYLMFRRSVLGIDTLHYYDLYAPLIKEVDLTFTYDQAKEHVLASLHPLGEEYVAVATRGLAERWVDVYPNEGKRSGAYSQGGVYSVHPYMLLNFNGKYDDMSTLAHELGHTMHSHLANATQPYPTSQYSIFVAEVASTFNEALLLDHMLKSIDDDSVRLALLGNYLDGLKATVFRQTQFAEYELRIHEIAERGESLTGDLLSTLYGRIAGEYYGQEKAVCIVDDDIGVEWASVPHFYYNFYVYQYATSFTASAALSEEVLGGAAGARERYLNLLRAGGADYPMALLRKAGIDMTTRHPFDLTMRKMNRVMDEMEAILKRTGRA